MHRFPTALLLLSLTMAAPARAGLYYSGETVADLPSQWSGFLLDQRTLRTIAVKPSGTTAVSPARTHYLDAAAKLEKTARSRKLTADELADLGAIYVRLGEPGKAVDLLRPAQHQNPNHFHLVANLATAWQLQGDLNQAADLLRQAVKLAPGKNQKYEEYQLKLVRFRQRQGRNIHQLDDLFGIHYTGTSGKYEPGKLAAAEQAKLPSDAAAIVQQLGLWLPGDGRLLWQAAEVANALGDVRTAAAILDGCVNEFGMRAPDLRAHRQVLRTAADELAKASGEGGLRAHEMFPSRLKPKSRRPLVKRLDRTALPPIRADGVNALPWPVVTETTLDRKYKPTFPKYLRELDGKQVELSGFMQPLNEDTDLNSFMLIEYPVGCWYCEMPELTAIVLIELPPGKTVPYHRGLIKVQGNLKLNPSDPENFLYTISKSQVKEAD